PILLSRASLSHLEAPMYLLMLLALWLHALWSEQKEDQLLYAAGAVMGLALICKLTALPLVPAFFFLELATLLRVRSAIVAFAKLILAACLAMFLAYLPWHGAWPAFKFSITNLLTFPGGQVYSLHPYYWRGQFLVHPSLAIGWLSWLIKAPLALLAL